MFAGGFFGNDQGKHQVDGLVVDGIELNALDQRHQHAHDVLQSFQPAVGNRDSLADAGASQSLAGDQVVEDLLDTDRVNLRGQFGVALIADDQMDIVL